MNDRIDRIDSRVDGRIPPHNADAERSVVAMALVSSEWAAVCRQHTSWRDFADGRLGDIFRAVEEVDDAGTEVTLVTVLERLRATGRDAQVGGSEALMKLSRWAPHNVHVEEHAAIVRKLAQRRALIRECHRIYIEGFGDVGDDFEDESAQRIFAVTQHGSKKNPPEHFGELIPAVERHAISAAKDEGAPLGVPSGLIDLQSILQDYKRGVMYVVAARPGMGKTAFAMQEALAVTAPRAGAAKQGAVVISAEMPKDQLARRAVANEAGIGIPAIETGKMSDSAWTKFSEAAKRLRTRPIAMHYKPGIKLHEIRSTVRGEHARLRRDFGVEELGLVVVDYIQILGTNSEKGKSRDQEIGELSRGLTQIAGEFNCPVIALSQLNRDVEKRKDKRPMLADLRESGSLEQDAFGVVFLYRDDYYDKGSAGPGVCEAIVAKHRNGACGTARLKWDGFCTRFRNLERYG